MSETRECQNCGFVVMGTCPTCEEDKPKGIIIKPGVSGQGRVNEAEIEIRKKPHFDKWYELRQFLSTGVDYDSLPADQRKGYSLALEKMVYLEEAEKRFNPKSLEVKA